MLGSLDKNENEFISKGSVLLTYILRQNSTVMD